MSHIFISYSHSDGKMMKRICDELRGAHLAIWTDEQLTPGTQSWQNSIQKAIEHAACVIVILSPVSKNSPWVTREVDYARTQGITIIPVLIAGTEKDAIHLSIIDVQYIDFRPDFNRGIQRLLETLRRLPAFHSTSSVKQKKTRRRRSGWLAALIMLVVVMLGIVLVVVGSLIAEKSTARTVPTLAQIPVFQFIAQASAPFNTVEVATSGTTAAVSAPALILTVTASEEQVVGFLIDNLTEEPPFSGMPDGVTETLHVPDVSEPSVAPALPVIVRSPPTAIPATRPPAVPPQPTLQPQPSRQQSTSTLVIMPTRTPTMRPSWTPAFTATLQPTPTPTVSQTLSNPGEVQIVGSFVAPGGLPNGIACVGQSLWLSDNGATIFHTDMAGNVIAAYSAPEGSPLGIAWAGDRFYLGTTSRNLVYAFQIQSGSLIAMSTFISPAQTVGGTRDDLAWDGSNLWYTNLYTAYKLDATGSVISSFAFGWEVDGFAWDGTAFWVVRNDFPATFMRVNAQGQILSTHLSSLLEIVSLDWCNGALWAVGRDQYPGQYKVFRLSY